ncbi:sporulation protein Spo0E [Thermoanaerobacterium sp. PSU-2]|uniref:aspartyl-phosphate phosphatase Spo0E family protein n=1 Tax=Thermoanaerobacterium sp. PSU-2 TaxID=1930849 RepID=UPI000A166FEB|nr:aspartyl-phosphate phosphatase Spo0E family protein [Thermoanaerobacterium sp. PSU-2]ORX24517.1 sporulation protein Spo0E [Thermoanaerobacterium sp. PSU-2]HHV73359.1 Spo0E family sporulation regulatory protein-aspartic acid phosphatase [Thermoanaerobacterium sp.]
MAKIIKEHYYKNDSVEEKIKLLKKELNKNIVDMAKALEISQELDKLIVEYMSCEKSAK